MATKKITTEKKDDEAIVPTKLIISSHITEKASMQSSKNAYTFVVRKEATKHTLLAEFKKEHKVTPKAINITNMPRKNTFIRGKKGTQAGIKKAVIFLKKGDTITLS